MGAARTTAALAAAAALLVALASAATDGPAGAVASAPAPATAATDGVMGPSQAPAGTPADSSSDAGSGPGEFAVEARLPPFQSNEEDAYLCTSVQLPDESLKLVGVDPLSRKEVVHHMLLFGAPPPGRCWLRAAAACRLLSSRLPQREVLSSRLPQREVQPARRCSHVCAVVACGQHLACHSWGTTQAGSGPAGRPTPAPAPAPHAQAARHLHPRTPCGTAACRAPAAAALRACCTAGARTPRPAGCPGGWGTRWATAPPSPPSCCRWVQGLVEWSGAEVAQAGGTGSDAWLLVSANRGALPLQWTHWGPS